MEFGLESMLIKLLVAGLLVLLVTFLVHSGLANRIEIRTGSPPIGACVVAYKFHTGPYRNVGSIFKEAWGIAPKLKGFGVYYDDPKHVEPKKLRAGIGCILAEGETKADGNLAAEFERRGFRLFELPAVLNAVSTAFPYRNQLSILIAVKRVYPALCSYIGENKLNGHPMLEIYEGSTIHFMAPLTKHEDFYVPEAKKSG